MTDYEPWNRKNAVLKKLTLIEVNEMWEEAATVIAGMCEGQDHKVALRIIERAKERLSE